MKKKKNSQELGIFNILLIGKNPHAISIADNIHAKFMKEDEVSNTCNFNIISDIDSGKQSNSWFNEFIFDVSLVAGRFNNIIISEGFKDWMETPMNPTERQYMKKLLQSMNTIIVDVSNDVPTKGDTFGGGGGYEVIFDNDIPQYNFNSDVGFLADLLKWIDGQMSKVAPKMSTIRLVRSLCGKTIPYLGDVFGCLSGKKYKEIVSTDKMRFDVPILYDEFCHLMKGRTPQDMEGVVITRTNSALAAFFK
jgi:hypothetical protein